MIDDRMPLPWYPNLRGVTPRWEGPWKTLTHEDPQWAVTPGESGRGGGKEGPHLPTHIPCPYCGIPAPPDACNIPAVIPEHLCVD